jgi:serine/threonine protein kinase
VTLALLSHDCFCPALGLCTWLEHGWPTRRSRSSTLDRVSAMHGVSSSRPPAADADHACRPQVMSAITYMHERGVIHRDLKAENLLLVDRDNPLPTVKLIDFGFSTILKHNLTGSFLGTPVALTRAWWPWADRPVSRFICRLQYVLGVNAPLAGCVWAAAGTGGYIAPEIRQQRLYSESVDIWACGVLLYLLLSCRLPFNPEVLWTFAISAWKDVYKTRSFRCQNSDTRLYRRGLGLHGF